MKIFVIEPHTRTPGHFEEQAVGTCRAFVSLKNEVTLVTYGGISKDHAGETLPFVVADAAPNGAKNLEARRTKAKPEADSFRAFLRREIQEYRTFRLALALLDREETCIMHFYYGDPLLLFLTLNADLIFRGKRQTARPLVVLTIHEISRLDPSTDFRRRVFRWIFRQ
ncbi:MAG: hypothetical protein ACRDHZ_05745, partial [Ktedonobacteraceae bacterium]